MNLLNKKVDKENVGKIKNSIDKFKIYLNKVNILSFDEKILAIDKVFRDDLKLKLKIWLFWVDKIKTEIHDKLLNEFKNIENNKEKSRIDKLKSYEDLLNLIRWTISNSGFIDIDENLFINWKEWLISKLINLIESEKWNYDKVYNIFYKFHNLWINNLERSNINNFILQKIDKFDFILKNSISPKSDLEIIYSDKENLDSYFENFYDKWIKFIPFKLNWNLIEEYSVILFLVEKNIISDSEDSKSFIKKIYLLKNFYDDIDNVIKKFVDVWISKWDLILFLDLFLSFLKRNEDFDNKKLNFIFDKISQNFYLFDYFIEFLSSDLDLNKFIVLLKKVELWENVNFEKEIYKILWESW